MTDQGEAPPSHKLPGWTFMAIAFFAMLGLAMFVVYGERRAAVPPEAADRSTPEDPAAPPIEQPDDPLAGLDDTPVIFGPLPRPVTTPPVVTLDTSVVEIEDFGALVFGGAILRIDDTTPDAVEAVLFSDDRKDLINRDIEAHSFYLPMELVTAAEGELDGAVWSFDAGSTDEVDELSGVFLADGTTLRPYSVNATFSAADEPNVVEVVIEGTFLPVSEAGNAADRKAVGATLKAVVRTR